MENPKPKQTQKSQGKTTRNNTKQHKITSQQQQYQALRQVRENVRNAVGQAPLKYNRLEEALRRIASQFQIPLQRWIQSSKLLQDALFQKKITEFLTKNKP